MKIDESLSLVRQVLSKERYDHTVRVLEVAKNLAIHFDITVEHVQLAAVFHDYAKEFKVDELKQYIINNRLDKRLLTYHDELWHGPVAAHIVEHEFGVKEQSILNAIHYHTTGRAQMDMIELAVFVADYIEPERSFPGLIEVREAAFINIHKAALLSLKNTIPYLIKKGALIFPDTFFAYNDLTLSVIGGNK